MTGGEKTVEKGFEILGYDSMEVARCSVLAVFHAYKCNPIGFLFPSICLF